MKSDDYQKSDVPTLEQAIPPRERSQESAVIAASRENTVYSKNKDISRYQKIRMGYMSEKNFLGVPLPEDTQSVVDQQPMSLAEFTAQIERQKSEYMKNPHQTVIDASHRRSAPIKMQPSKKGPLTEVEGETKLSFSEAFLNECHSPVIAQPTPITLPIASMESFILRQSRKDSHR